MLTRSRIGLGFSCFIQAQGLAKRWENPREDPIFRFPSADGSEGAVLFETRLPETDEGEGSFIPSLTARDVVFLFLRRRSARAYLKISASETSRVGLEGRLMT